jgi:hypothetical protein
VSGVSQSLSHFEVKEKSTDVAPGLGLGAGIRHTSITPGHLQPESQRALMAQKQVLDKVTVVRL